MADLKNKYLAPPCTLRTFFIGLSDWWAEQFLPATARPAPPARSTPSRLLQGLTLLLLLCAMPVLLSLFAPAVAHGFSFLGPRVVSRVAEGLLVALSVALAVGVPVLAGRRVFHFCSAMCERGYDIQTGRRTRVRCL